MEDENRQFAERYLEIEEENNNLANLYVASYQLHSTLDLDEVLKIILEIVINLIGAEVFAVYMLDRRGRTLERRGVRRRRGDRGVPGVPASEKGFRSGEAVDERRDHSVWDPSAPGDLTEAHGRASRCRSRGSADRRDRDLQPAPAERRLHGPGSRAFQPCSGGHAATAIFAAQLYSQSERKLNTIQGFIDLLSEQ